MNKRRILSAAVTLAGWAMIAPVAGIAAPPVPTAPVHGLAVSRVANDAAGFIQDLGKRAIDVLVQPGANKATTAGNFQRLLEEGFDVPTVGRFVLGRYWNEATPAQQTEYLSLFKRLIANVYADRFATYAGKDLSVEKNLKIDGVRPEGERDQTVQTQLIRPDGPPVKVDWRVRNQNGQFKIVDVAVEGVSMAVTQRSEFASVIQRGGGNIESLLQALRQRVAGG